MFVWGDIQTVYYVFCVDIYYHKKRYNNYIGKHKAALQQKTNGCNEKKENLAIKRFIFASYVQIIQTILTKG